MRRSIESYAHAGKKRANNPPVGLVTPETDRDAGGRVWAHDPHVPVTGARDGWARLARNLRAGTDESRIKACRGAVSLPFEAGEHRRAAVKIVDDRGIESLKVVELE